jgi:nitrate/nitrite-specific signal transduction histidine kinase
VQDNGVGFDPARDPQSFGLYGMRERAEEIGADLTVDSQPGKGTRVLLRWARPYENGLPPPSDTGAFPTSGEA